MAGINKCIFVGNVTKEVDVFTFDSGDKKTSFSIAVNESYKNKDGERVDLVEFINIVAFRGLAEVCEKYVTKGMQVYIEGKFKTRMWEKDGKKNYVTEIFADNMVMLSKKESAGVTEPKAEPIQGEEPGDLPF